MLQLKRKLSLFDKEMLKSKLKNENFAYNVIAIITQFVWSIHDIQIKNIQLYFQQKNYSINSFIFWRSLPLIPLSYILNKKKNSNIPTHSDIEHKIWFYFRNIGSYISLYLSILITDYFSYAIKDIITYTTPLLIILLAVIFLKENCYIRYLLFVIICILGICFIVFNKQKMENMNIINNEENISFNIFIGVCFYIILSLSLTGQKVMVNEKIELNAQNFYISLYNFLFALIFCLINFSFYITDIKYIILCFINGLFFYIGSYLTGFCLQFIEVSKFQPVTYFSFVFYLIIQYFIISKNIYKMDIIGIILIVGVHVYNLYFTSDENCNNTSIPEIDEKELKNNFLAKNEDDDSESL